LSTMISESQENKPESILRVDNLGIDYASDFGRIHALRNVSLEVAPGEILGVVGESGSGKTTLALAVSRLLKMPPAIRTKGRVSFENTNVLLSSERKIDKIRGTGIFMIFQDPFMSLNPLMTVGDQLLEAIRIRCRHNSEDYQTEKALSEAIGYLKDVRVGDAEDVIHRYPHQLSGGQNQRIMLAMALAEKPRLLIADEPTTALDVTTQAQVLNILKDIVVKTKMAVLYITHDLSVAGVFCDRIAVMYGGMVQEIGKADQVLLSPKHPYTIGLIKSIPSKKKSEGLLEVINGTFSMVDKEECLFAPRCPLVHETCLNGIPRLYTVEGQEVRCVNYGEK